jgi:ribonuclease HI
MLLNKLVIFTDGGARGNPGPAGIGAVAFGEDQKIMFEVSEYLGVATNNQAEYKAVIRALEEAKKQGASELDFYLDSELVVKQLNREYKVKNQDLAPLFVKVYNLTLGFKKVKFSHIRREQNEAADKLANLAMDQQFKI